MRRYKSTISLACLLLFLSVLSLFIGVLDIDPGSLLLGDRRQMEIFLLSRLPRLLAILCTGVGMSVAGLIMQQLCMNKFVSPTTGATIQSAQLGIALGMVFFPKMGLGVRTIFAFAMSVAGTLLFVFFVQRIKSYLPLLLSDNTKENATIITINILIGCRNNLSIIFSK